jgi:hypothetical protein
VAIELRLLIVAVLTGTTVELLHQSLPAYEAQTTVLPSPAPPLWLLILWAQFATTFRYCLRAVLTVPWRAMLFGALGGPIAFWAASRLGALDLTPPIARGLATIGITWTLALLLFTAIVGRMRGAPLRPTYRCDRR